MKLLINEPCCEPWDDMLVNAKGRHCSKCDKTVVDFSKFKDDELIEFFKKHQNVCGRFENTQLNRELIVRNRTYAPFKYAACGLIALSALGAHAQVNDSLPIKTEQQVKPTDINAGTNIIKLKINQPDVAEQRILKVKIQLDSFAIEVPIDSTNVSSFHIPNSLWYNHQMHTQLFNVKGDTIPLVIEYSFLVSEFTFTQNGDKWLYYSNAPVFQDFRRYEYVWGPPVSIPIVNIRIPEVTKIVSDSIFTTGLTVNPDSVHWPTDSQKENKKLETKTYKKIEDKSRVWYWWAGGFMVFLGGWFIRNRSRKLEE